MNNQKQETSLKLSSPKSINYFAVCGRVVIKPVFKEERGHVFAKSRLKIYTSATSCAYVDVYGFGDVANEMNLACQLGNTVLVECHLTNKIYVNKKGIKKARMLFIVDKIDSLIVKPIKEVNVEEELEILDELDPYNYLGDSFGIKD